MRQDECRDPEIEGDAMEDEMGKVIVKVELVNDGDLTLIQRGFAPEGSERRKIVDGLVDTGATMLSIPEDISEELGLSVRRKSTVRLADGSSVMMGVAGPVSVTF